MVRIYVAIGGLLVALLLAAFVGPLFVDWSQYRQNFETEATRLLGREVRVGGDASARLLPFPSVTFEDVRIAEDGGIALDIERFEMDLELAPFLRGEYLIFDMRMVRPQLRISLTDGRLPGSATSRMLNDDSISIERLEIVDGAVRTITPTGTARATDVDMVLRADTLAGPWSGEGDATVAGERFAIDATTGRFLADGASTRLLLSVAGDALPLPVTVAGDLSLVDGIPTYRGEATASRSAEPAVAFTAAYEATANGLMIEEYRTAIGPRNDPYVIVGSATIEGAAQPRFDLEARGQRLDTERIAPDALTPGPSFADRLDALERLVENIPDLPIDGAIDIALPAIVLPEGTAQNVKLTARADDGTWTIEEASVLLPGRTRVSASGTLGTVNGLRFEGEVAALSRQPTGLVTWLGNPIDEPLRSLGTLGFGGDLTATREEAILENASIVVGRDELRGRIAYQQGEANIALDTSNIDLVATRSALAGVLGDEDAKPAAQFELTADRADYDGIALAGLTAKGSASEHSVRLDRAVVADLAGAQIEASGDYAIDGNGATGLSLSVLAGEPTAALALLAERTNGDWAATLSRRSEAVAPLRADLDLAWIEPNAPIGFEATGRAGSLDWSAGGAFAVLAGDNDSRSRVEIGSMTMTVEGDIPGILRVAGLPSASTTSPRSATIEMEYERTETGHRADVSMTSRDDTAEVTLIFGEQGDLVRASAEAASIRPYAAALGSPLVDRLDFSLDGGIDATSDGAFWSVEIGELQLDEALVTGRLIGNRWRWQGDVDVGILDLASLVSLPLGVGIDDTSDRDAPFGPSPLPPVDLLVSVDARVAELPAGAVARDATLRVRATGDAIAIEEFEGSLADGMLRGNLSVRNGGNAALVSFTGTLEDADLSLLPEPIRKSLSDGRITADASLEATGESATALLRSATGAGSMTIANPTIEQLDPFALARVYEAVDALDEPPDADTVRTIVRDTIFESRFEPSELTANASLGSGTLRISIPEVSDEGPTLDGRARVNLLDGTLSADLDVAFAVPDDRASGGNPTIRLSFDGIGAEPTIDVAPLTGFLNLRAFEIERDRVAALRASLVERQRLRREALLFGAEEREAERKAEEARLAKAAAEAARSAERVSDGPPSPRLTFPDQF